ncbi:hypothetical protein ACMBCN_02495 [Candidatus Liberibacter asiaticus]|nr:hypothetical protein [Candidatus Liberibacter asiaticus]
MTLKDIWGFLHLTQREPKFAIHKIHMYMGQKDLKKEEEDKKYYDPKVPKMRK